MALYPDMKAMALYPDIKAMALYPDIKAMALYTNEIFSLKILWFQEEVTE